MTGAEICTNCLVWQTVYEFVVGEPAVRTHVIEYHAQIKGSGAFRFTVDGKVEKEIEIKEQDEWQIVHGVYSVKGPTHNKLCLEIASIAPTDMMRVRDALIRRSRTQG